MINNLSKRFVDRLLSDGTITQEEYELYVYGLFMLLSQIMFLIVICIIGISLGCILESIIFYIAFQFTRRYAGGYHAATETKCEILSTLSLLACVCIIKLSKFYDFQIAMIISTVLSAICILLFCPLDTPEKPLSEKEFKYFRRVSWLILFVIVLLIVVSYCFRIRFAFVPLCMSLILESVLLISGKIKSIILKRKKCQN